MRGVGRGEVGVLQMPRLKGADVQFIIYIPHDGQNVSHEVKVKKKKTTSNALSRSSPRAPPHPLSSCYIFPSRSHHAKRPLSFSSPHFIFRLSPTCPFFPHTKPVFFSPCALPLRVSSLYLSFSHPPPSHQQL